MSIFRPRGTPPRLPRTDASLHSRTPGRYRCRRPISRPPPRRNPLRPYGIAYCRVYVLSTCGVLKKPLCSPVCGLSGDKGEPRRYRCRRPISARPPPRVRLWRLDSILQILKAESCPLNAVHLSRHKWLGGLVSAVLSKANLDVVCVGDPSRRDHHHALRPQSFWLVAQKD